MSKISRSLKVKLLSVSIIFIFAISMASPASALKRIFEQDKELVLDDEGGATHYSSVIDTDGVRHFIYLRSHDGEATPFDEEGETDEYDLVYGTYDSHTYEAHFTNVLTNVFAYHYNLELGSDNSLHITYIAGNNTVFYATKAANSDTWNHEQITTPDPIPGVINGTWPTVGIRAAEPAITLNDLNEPHIVFAAIFNDHDATLNSSIYSLQNIKTIFYAVRNSSGWYLYDIVENHDRRDFENELRVFPGNPAISVYETGAIEDVYIPWNNKFSLGTESRLRMVNFRGQFPDGQGFIDRAIQAIDDYGIFTVFRRAEIYRINDSLVLFYGTTIQGAARAAWLENRHIPWQLQEWVVFVLDDERSFNGVWSMDTTLGDDGYVYLTWAMHDDYSPLNYEYDVYMATFDPREYDADYELADRFDYARITLSDNYDNIYPTINIYNGTSEISYIKINATHTTIQYSHEIPQLIPASNSVVGFFIGLLLAGLFVGISVILIKKLPEPEKEEEILPHMVNLKDSIETH